MNSRVYHCTAWKCLITIIILGAAGGCGTGSGQPGSGSGTGSSSGGNQGGGGAITASARMAVIGAAETKLSALQSLDNATRNTQMVAYLKSQPVFSAAGVAPDNSIWARFTDDRYYVINDSLEPAQPPTSREASMSVSVARSVALAGQAASGRQRSSGRLAATRTAGPALPKSIQVRLLNSLNSALNPPTDALSKMFSMRGYNVLVQDATVDTLKSISGDGVFHFSSHGGTAVAQDSSKNYCVFTSTPVTAASDQLYQDDLKSHRLVYFTAANGYTAVVFKKYQTNYGITQDFVTNYKWSFATNSIAFCNFCWSDAEGFTGTVADQGASITAGWSNAADPTNAWKNARYFFDRLLGTNTEPPLEQGNQRPFNVAAVVPDMQSKGLMDASTTQYGPCKLVITGTGDGMLAPSIQTMDVQERWYDSPLQGYSRLTINGQFGDGAQPKVTVGGTSVISVEDFSSTLIHCKIASTPGSGFAGNVVVTTDQGIKSNAVPLSVWEGDFIYSCNIFPFPKITSNLTVHAIFRADIHEYRTKPGGALLQQKAKAFRAAQGSTAHWETIGGPPPDSHWVNHTADMSYGLNGQPAPFGTGYILEGFINPSGNSAAIAFSYLGCVAVYQIPAPGVPPVKLALVADPIIVTRASSPGQTPGDIIYSPLVLATVATDGSITGADRTGVTTPASNTHFMWQTITPTNGPDNSKGEDYGL